MYIIEMMKMLLTHSSTAEQEEKQEERGSCQTLAEKKKMLAKVGCFFNKIKKS